MLRTLGGLAVEGQVRQRKPLLVACFLALEGAQPRRRIARLVWPHTARPLSNLSVALSTLRAGAPGLVQADAQRAWSLVPCDVHALLDALERGDLEVVRSLHRGPFLHGVPLEGCSPELEEWCLTTREFVADRVRAALLTAAEDASELGEPAQAAALAHEAYRVPAAPPAAPRDLPRLHRLLSAVHHPTAGAVAAEARELDVTLAAAPPRATPGADRGTAPALPAPRSPLVGRDPELTHIASLLASGSCPALVIHGPGGIGKSRLALQVAYEQRGTSAFADGCAFLEMEAEPPGTDLSETVLRRLGLNGGSDPDAELRRRLRDAHLLLVIDSVEHLPEIGPWMDAWLGACPGVRVVLTSRRRPTSRLATVFPLRGLPLSDPDTPADQALHADAIRLFEQSARRVDARFRLEPADVRHVRTICRAVEGSPLGIELAAAWVRAVPLQALASELAQDLTLLGSVDRAEAGDLRRSFERSWARLRAVERDALARLSVFTGGFTLGAARAVAETTIPTLAGLVDASLVRFTDGGRYDRHPLVHAFARERLEADAAELHRMQRRHARHALEAVARLGTGGPSSAAGMAELEPEFENVRAAWRAAVALGEPELLAAAALPLARWCDARARLRDGAALFAMLLDRRSAEAASADTAAPAWVLAIGRGRLARAWMWLRLGRYREAEAEAGAGAALLGSGRDPHTLAWAMHTLGTAAYKAGRYVEATDLFRQMHDAAAAAGDDGRRAEALGRLALVAQASGDDDLARERYLEALALSRSVGSEVTEVTQLLNLGALELNQGRTTEAERRFRAALGRAEAVGYDQIVPILLHNLANVASKQGDHGEARRHAREALERVRASGERGLESGMLATLGWISLEAGDPAGAEAEVRQALELAHRIDDAPATLTAMVRLAQVWVGRGRGAQALPLLDAVLEHPATLTWARRLAGRVRREAAGAGSAPGGEPAFPGLDALVEGILAGA